MTPSLFHVGWAALLLVLAALCFASPGRRTRPSLGLQIVLAGAVLAWALGTLSVIASDHPAALEVEGFTLEPPARGVATLSLGAGEAADVRLPDRYTAPVHALVHWDLSRGDPEPWIWNASDSRRLELDGRDIHEVVLQPGDILWLGEERLEVLENSGWPALVLRDEAGVELRLPAPAARGLVAALPRVGEGLRTRVGSLLADGEGALLLDAGTPAPPDGGPIASLLLEGRQPVLAYPSPTDRVRHPVRVQRAGGGEPIRPADRWTRLVDGQHLALGYSAYRVGVSRSGRVQLTSVAAPGRWDWPGEEAVLWGFEPGVLAVGDSSDGSLSLTSLDASPSGGFRRAGGTLSRGEGGRARGRLVPGDRLELEVADGAHVQLRLAARAALRDALAGRASALDQQVWRLLLLLALLYLAIVVLATRGGLLHARSAGVLHGAAILFALGLICLYRLSDPADPYRAGWALRQAQLGTVGGLVALTLAAAGWLRAPQAGPLASSLFAWLDGSSEGAGRARWLYLLALAVLLLQLPFGEVGITGLGLGSLQPIEAARSLLVIYLAYWTSRAIEVKRQRLRGEEGFKERWSYMVHALPVLAILGLCYGLADISPILVFGSFIGVLYAASLIRPSLRLWPPRVLREHLGVELLGLVAVLAVLTWVVLGDPDGTVATRLRTWWDPWKNSAEAYQAVTALWTSAQGGVFGLGWVGENGVLPPAVRDDFILALLAARGGAVAVMGVAATFGVVLLSGAAALSGTHALTSSPAQREEASLLAAATLWMLAIQAAVVLGSATGGLPVMGQPLPFVAAAGSHLLLFCIPATALVLGSTRVRVPERRSLRGARRPSRASRPVLDPLSVVTVTEGGS